MLLVHLLRTTIFLIQARIFSIPWYMPTRTRIVSLSVESRDESHNTADFSNGSLPLWKYRVAKPWTSWRMMELTSTRTLLQSGNQEVLQWSVTLLAWLQNWWRSRLSESSDLAWPMVKSWIHYFKSCSLCKRGLSSTIIWVYFFKIGCV
jgi:hypothetical protein